MMGYLERELERGERAIRDSLAIGELSEEGARQELIDLRNSYEAAVDQEAERQVYDYELRHP